MNSLNPEFKRQLWLNWRPSLLAWSLGLSLLVLALPIALSSPNGLPGSLSATAIAGLTRCVRTPGPCRPMKLRFEVEAMRCCGLPVSPFMPTHIEQPGARHSMARGAGDIHLIPGGQVIAAAARAIEAVPRTWGAALNSAFRFGYFEPPVPVPCGQPVWAMKPSMTR